MQGPRIWSHQVNTNRTSSRLCGCRSAPFNSCLPAPMARLLTWCLRCRDEAGSPLHLMRLVSRCVPANRVSTVTVPCAPGSHDEMPASRPPQLLASCLLLEIVVEPTSQPSAAFRLRLTCAMRENRLGSRPTRSIGRCDPAGTGRSVRSASQASLSRKALQTDLSRGGALGRHSGGGIRTRDLRVMRSPKGGRVRSGCPCLLGLGRVRWGPICSKRNLEWNHED